MQSSEVNLVAQGLAAIGPMWSGEFQRDATSPRRGCPFMPNPEYPFRRSHWFRNAPFLIAILIPSIINHRHGRPPVLRLPPVAPAAQEPRRLPPLRRVHD